MDAFRKRTRGRDETLPFARPPGVNSGITASPDDGAASGVEGQGGGDKKRACVKEFVDKSRATQNSCYLVATFAANVRLV